LLKLLKPLNLKTRYDEISLKILKISSPFIVAPLNHICNRTILSGKFPSRMKYSIIKPISILPSFSKIYEKIIHARLLEHATKNNILSAEQFGLRSNSSTQKATFILLNDILQALSNKSFVEGIFCDDFINFVSDTR
jgi:hypothetical protein